MAEKVALEKVYSQRVAARGVKNNVIWKTSAKRCYEFNISTTKCKDHDYCLCSGMIV